MPYFPDGAVPAGKGYLYERDEDGSLNANDQASGAGIRDAQRVPQVAAKETCCDRGPLGRLRPIIHAGRRLTHPSGQHIGVVPRLHFTDRSAAGFDSLSAAHEHHAAAGGGDSATDGELPCGARANVDDRKHLLARNSISR